MAFLPSPLLLFFNKKQKQKAKLAEVFKYFILVSNVNSYIVIAVLGVFCLHMTFCNIFVNHLTFFFPPVYSKCIKGICRIVSVLLCGQHGGTDCLLLGSVAPLAAPSPH